MDNKHKREKIFRDKIVSGKKTISISILWNNITDLNNIFNSQLLSQIGNLKIKKRYNKR